MASSGPICQTSSVAWLPAEPVRPEPDPAQIGKVLELVMGGWVRI
jgi:hypothetical protein